MFELRNLKDNLVKIISLIIAIVVLAFMIIYYVMAYRAAKNNESFSLFGVKDKRVPAYEGTQIDMQPREYSYSAYNGAMMFNTVQYYDKNMYEYYHGLDRYYELDEYTNYVLDEKNLEVVSTLVTFLRTCKMQAGYSDYEMVLEAINFVQKNIVYAYDQNSQGLIIEYPKYPIETLYEGCGDCEDTSILLAAIIKELDYGVILLAYDDHMAVGIQGGETVYGKYYEYEGERYFYVETTANGWTIGDVPDEYINKPAQVMVIN